MASTTRAQPKPKEKPSGKRFERGQNSSGEAVATGLFRKLHERGGHVTGMGGATQVCFDSGVLEMYARGLGCGPSYILQTVVFFLSLFLGFASASPRFLVRSFVFALALSSSQRYWSFRGFLCVCGAQGSGRWLCVCFIVQPLLTALDTGRVHASLPRLSPFLLPFWEQQTPPGFRGCR